MGICTALCLVFTRFGLASLFASACITAGALRYRIKSLMEQCGFKNPANVHTAITYLLQYHIVIFSLALSRSLVFAHIHVSMDDEAEKIKQKSPSAQLKLSIPNRETEKSYQDVKSSLYYAGIKSHTYSARHHAVRALCK